MRIRNGLHFGMAMGLAGMGVAMGQTSLPGGAAGTQAATRPILTNIEAVMEREVEEFVVADMPLDKVVATLKEKANANVVVNWRALAGAGVERDRKVSLRLKKLNTEQVIRALCETLSAPDSRLNYVVGEGAVEITTNAALGKETVTKLMEVGKILPAASEKEKREAMEKLLLAVGNAELVRIGERVKGEERELQVKGDYLVAKQSRRGAAALQRVVNAFNAPLKPGSVPPGVVASVRQKKAEAAMAVLLDRQNKVLSLEEIAFDPAKFAPELNVVGLPSWNDMMLPGNDTLDYLVNEAGVVYIGSAKDIRSRTLFAVYDLRDVVKKLQGVPENKEVGVEELSRRVVAKMKEKVTPWIWSEVGKGPCSMTAYGQLMVVFAPAPVYRAIGAGWKEVEK